MDSLVEISGTYDLCGKAAIVTGASRGIGRAIAVALAKAGADVVVVARSGQALQELATEIRGLGRACLSLPCDVSNRDEIVGVVDRAVAEFGHIDIMINNAGVVGHWGPFLDLTLTDWDDVLDTNLKAVVTFSHTVGKHMVERGSGSLINITAVAGLSGFPMLSHYSATKAAVHSLTKTLGAEWAASGVRANAIAPGWTDTKMTESVVGNEVGDGLIHGVPARRWGVTDDLLGPTLFLASDASRWVTGTILVADGGLSAYGGNPTVLDAMAMGRVAT